MNRQRDIGGIQISAAYCILRAWPSYPRCNSLPHFRERRFLLSCQASLLNSRGLLHSNKFLAGIQTTPTLRSTSVCRALSLRWANSTMSCLRCSQRWGKRSELFRQETFPNNVHRSFLFGYDSGVMTDGECSHTKKHVSIHGFSSSNLSHQSSTLQTFKISSTRTKQVLLLALSIPHSLVVQCSALSW